MASSDTAHIHISSPVVVTPDLVLDCGIKWAGLEHLLIWDCVLVVTGVQAAVLPSEVWAAYGVLS